MAAVLEADDCHVVAPDLRGHGRSDHGGVSSQYHLRDFVGDLAEIVQVLGNRPFILVGHSLGAIIAVLYATAFPENVQQLILAEPPLSPIPDDAQNFTQQMTSYLSAVNGVRQHAPMPDLQSAATRLRQLTPALSMEAALRQAERLTKPNGDGVVWRWDTRLDGQAQLNALFAGLRRTEFLAMLSGIRPVDGCLWRFQRLDQSCRESANPGRLPRLAVRCAGGRPQHSSGRAGRAGSDCS